LPIVIGDACACQKPEQEAAAMHRINNFFAPVILVRHLRAASPSTRLISGTAKNTQRRPIERSARNMGRLLALIACAACDPDVWSGRALQENFDRDGGCAVLHQCIRPLIGAFCAPGYHGYQRACDLITG
jgi:hypothetical protein